MLINVRSYAFLRKYTAHLPNGGELKIPEHFTVGDVMQLLQVPLDSKKIILVNGRAAELNHLLQAGDLLVFYPLLEGG